MMNLLTDLYAVQSLIIPFAFLIQKDPGSVLDLLEPMTLENGQNGLQVLLSAWCENAETFIGGWASRTRFVQHISGYFDNLDDNDNLIYLAMRL
jgi:hypothetical protein